MTREEGLKPSLNPFRSGSDADVEIDLYVVTGKHGFLRIPETFCKECNLFYRAAEKAAEDVDAEVDISVKSYWTSFLLPLLKGGFHAPVMLVNGELVAQGYDVPEEDFLKDKMREMAED